MTGGNGEKKQETPEELKRLVGWNADILLKILKQVVAKREAAGKAGWDAEPVIEIKDNVNDEVVEVINLPPFNKEAANHPKSIEVDPQVADQLKDFVAAIAQAYRGNAYHCLQHASHATMAVNKLISRIAVGDSEAEHAAGSSEVLAEYLHNQTYGIASDPMAQFAVAIAALIHAVDHRGVSNEALAAEEPEIAKKHKGVALTEQLSFEKAWKKLMNPEFENLRRCIYADAEEKKRFRQVLVNCVMATDEADEEAQTRRQARWDKSFGPGASVDEDPDRRATSVIECLMQAADVFHTMQHWHVYVKWTERGFEEATLAYKAGRIPADPAKTWYRDQLNHFDNFVIPLTMQMKDIDAFVVYSDEYLNYALKNRQRWASNGREIVAALVAKYTTGSATAKTDLIKAISKEGKNDDASTKDAAASRHLKRLVDWNNEVLQQQIKAILAKRQASGKPLHANLPSLQTEGAKMYVDEVAETINFPVFDVDSTADKLKPSSVQLTDDVATQLKEFVGHVSSQFRDHPFHCLDHASYVSMMAKKLLGRLMQQSAGSTAADYHKKTFGLISDPLAQFAVVFSALIHDMDHSGVPNSQLVLDNGDLSKKYKQRSITEQHSIDLAWNQLMQPEFEDLRGAICSDEAELKRFRQIVVNAVLATDFTDKGLVDIRKSRWEKAFGNSGDDMDLKATIAIVLILQGADSFHAIQHWHVYKKWNERDFFENYSAFEKGRVKEDPSRHWFDRELRFLEEHVIPLCKQMQELGAFGSSADEFLAFATKNKEKWTAEGADLIKAMVDKCLGKDGEKSMSTQRMSLSND